MTGNGVVGPGCVGLAKCPHRKRDFLPSSQETDGWFLHLEPCNGAWFKKGSGTVAGTARRVLRTTVPSMSPRKQAPQPRFFGGPFLVLLCTDGDHYEPLPDLPHRPTRARRRHKRFSFFFETASGWSQGRAVDFNLSSKRQQREASRGPGGGNEPPVAGRMPAKSGRDAPHAAIRAPSFESGSARTPTCISANRPRGCTTRQSAGEPHFVISDKLKSLARLLRIPACHLVVEFTSWFVAVRSELQRLAASR
jgi:hypothetical protein